MVHRYYPWKIVLLEIFDYNNASFPNLQLSFLLFSNIGVHFHVMCNT
jgi:myosin heavy subunit